MKNKNELEKRLTLYLYKVISGCAKDKKKYSNTYENFTEEIENYISLDNYLDLEENLDNDYYHLEKIFMNKDYYNAMRKVPIIQKKVIYLLFVNRLKVKEAAKKLNLTEDSVKKFKKLGIKNFKKNLEELK